MSLSKELFERGKKVIPGGVNSPVRAFYNVGRTPLFIKKASGSKIYDVDDNEYIDFVNSWGPMILGHSYTDVIESVKTAMINGLSFGAPTEKEVLMAELICELVPNVEMVRMVNSGTEAVMSALRLARGYTGKNKIIKFEGCYHGHSDSMLVKAGSGALTEGVPNSAGVIKEIAENTLVAKYNDLSSVEMLFQKNKNDIACIIVEPVAANMGVVIPEDGFLQGLRKLCDENNALLILMRLLQVLGLPLVEHKNTLVLMLILLLSVKLLVEVCRLVLTVGKKKLWNILLLLVKYTKLELYQEILLLWQQVMNNFIF